MRTTRAVATVLAMGLVLSAGFVGSAIAQQAETDPADTGEKITFTWGDTATPSSLSPMKGYLAADFYFWTPSYHLLTDFAVDDFAAEPMLATKVETSSDGMTFTYTIRNDLKWSDGEPVTAEDVAFTLNLYKSNHAYLPSGYLKLIDSVEATGPTTVVIHSKEPTGLYSGKVAYMYDYILPEHIWANLKEKPKQYDNVPSVGSGPFYIAEYKTDQYVRMERNKYWTGPAPHFDEIIYRIFKNEDAEAEALKAGEIDFGYFDSANIFNSLKGQPDIGTMVGSIPSFDEIGMNTGSAYQEKEGAFVPHGDGNPVLQDVEFRRAIRMAIDSQEVSEKVLLGYAPAGDSIIPPVSVPGARWEPTGEEAIPFDLEAAKQALEDAGYVDKDGNGIREDPKTGEDIVLRYYVQTNDRNTTKVAPFVQSWLKQVGIKADVTAMSSGRLGDEINAGTYDLFHWGWIPDPDPDSALSWFTCEQRPPDGSTYGNNDSYYCNPEYDKLYREQRTELDLQKRMEIVQEMQRIYYEDAAYAVLWYAPLLQAYRTDTFTGYMPQPAPKGDLLTGWTDDVWLSLRPVSVGSAQKATKGVPAAVWIGIVVGVLVVVGAVFLLRGRGAEEDKA